MNTPDITDLHLPDVHLPSLATIGDLVAADEIADLAESVVKRVRRFTPWSPRRSNWRTYALMLSAVATVAAVTVVLKRRRARDDDQHGHTASTTNIHRAA
jgi:hypothetical protein